VIAGLIKSNNAARRIAALLLFFAFLGLPFHSHAIFEAPRIAKECSCVHGTRTDAALIVEGAVWAPLIQVAACAISLPQICSHTLISFLAIRAPPLS
jgi:hypothetical protein